MVGDKVVTERHRTTTTECSLSLQTPSCTRAHFFCAHSFMLKASKVLLAICASSPTAQGLWSILFHGPHLLFSFQHVSLHICTAMDPLAFLLILMAHPCSSPSDTGLSGVSLSHILSVGPEWGSWQGFSDLDISPKWRPTALNNSTAYEWQEIFLRLHDLLQRNWLRKSWLNGFA